MNHAMAQGLAAVFSFWFDLLQVLTLIVIISGWLKVPQAAMVVDIIQYMLHPLLRPFRAIAPKSKDMDWGAAMFLAVIIPIQFIVVYKLRNLQ